MSFWFPPAEAAVPRGGTSDGAERHRRRGTGAGPESPRTLVRCQGPTAVTVPWVARGLPCPDGPDRGGQSRRRLGRARRDDARSPWRGTARSPWRDAAGGPADALRPLAGSGQGPLTPPPDAARHLARDPLPAREHGHPPRRRCRGRALGRRPPRAQHHRARGGHDRPLRRVDHRARDRVPRPGLGPDPGPGRRHSTRSCRAHSPTGCARCGSGRATAASSTARTTASSAAASRWSATSRRPGRAASSPAWTT